MRKRTKYLLLLAIVLAVVGVVVAAFMPSKEPEYQGKRLSEWVERANWPISTNSYRSVVGPNRLSLLPKFDPRRENSHDIWRETEWAVRHIGPPAIPYLLNWIRYEPSPLKLKFLGRIDRIFRTRLRDRDSLRAGGATASIIALGSGAEPAIPELAKLARDLRRPVTANHAAWALICLARELLAAGIALMDNGDPALRRYGLLMSSITSHGDMGPAVPILCRCLKDTEEEIAVKSAEILSGEILAGDVVVPALVEALRDNRTKVLRASIRALLHFPIEETRIAAPALLALSRNPDPEVRHPAEDALDNIDAAGGRSRTK